MKSARRENGHPREISTNVGSVEIDGVIRNAKDMTNIQGASQEGHLIVLVAMIVRAQLKAALRMRSMLRILIRTTKTMCRKRLKITLRWLRMKPLLIITKEVKALINLIMRVSDLLGKMVGSKAMDMKETQDLAEVKTDDPMWWRTIQTSLGAEAQVLKEQ